MSDGRLVVAEGVGRDFAVGDSFVHALRDVDFVVPEGTLAVVHGRSGSGKTTLLTIIAGWEKPDSGSVVLDGSICSTSPRTWSALAIVPQSLGLLDELSIAENLALPLRLAPRTPADDPSEVIARLGLDRLADRYPSEVSLGEQQRAALGRAVVVKPALLLADEPIAHQNREWAETMILVVGLLAARGTACVLATHNDIAFEGAHRVLELRQGRLVPLSSDEHGSQP